VIGTPSPASVLRAQQVAARAAAAATRPRDGPYTLLKRAVVSWWEGRLPFTDTWTLTQGNIYILPTKAGIVYAVTLLLMLLASINYQLNLGYVLTFLLAGSGLVSMHLTHGTLRGLTLRLRAGPPVFAGEPALVEIVFDNPGRERHGVALHFHDRRAHGPSFAWTDVPALGQASAHVSIVPPRRGSHRVPTLVVETAFPFGLFRAWTLWRPAAHVLAYPRPESPLPPLPSAVPVPGEQRHARRGEGAELDGVRAWRRGDRLRHIVWKKVARTGELVSRDTAGSSVRELNLDWSATRCSDDEQRLSRLAAWVLTAEREGLMYRVQLPGIDLGSGQGDAQRRAALEALALWQPAR
jgi:uncharacterized protein (DUF58 family)